MNTHGNLVEALAHSPLFREFARAYNGATGLPVALRPVETWQLPLHRKGHENRFCARMAGRSRTCAACLQAQERLSRAALEHPSTVTCAYGLSEMAVPVRVGREMIGFLQTGQVFRRRPSDAQFARIAGRVSELGLAVDGRTLRRAYYATPALSAARLKSVTRLLTVFAEHLALRGNEIAVQRANAEPTAISRARQFILEHLAEDLSLEWVAGAVNTSTYYFCKLFRRVTGIHFAKFISRARVERARTLLLNQNLRVSEIAYEAGFRSLTHFNRVFKNLVRESPTSYRGHLPGGGAARSPAAGPG